MSLYCNKGIHELNFGMKAFKSVMMKTKVFCDLMKHKNDKILLNDYGNKLMKECCQPVTIQRSIF